MYSDCCRPTNGRPISNSRWGVWVTHPSWRESAGKLAKQFYHRRYGHLSADWPDDGATHRKDLVLDLAVHRREESDKGVGDAVEEAVLSVALARTEVVDEEPPEAVLHHRDGRLRLEHPLPELLEARLPTRGQGRKCGDSRDDRQEDREDGDEDVATAAMTDRRTGRTGTKMWQQPRWQTGGQGGRARRCGDSHDDRQDREDGHEDVMTTAMTDRRTGRRGRRCGDSRDDRQGDREDGHEDVATAAMTDRRTER